ncbi:hypothetical protein [Kozakia baliensis]|uniref:hypothetical protein n=1 Tax=Kozakia baliensis TaxID=153496 RepID=UPI001246F3F6|nr:hypothetical protein [Kozakia baliensis]
MSEKFISLLKYVKGNNAQNIWDDLNFNVEEKIDTKKSIAELIDFFSFLLSSNIILEYDLEKQCPVFSGDSPTKVAERIFSDFSEKNPNVPDQSPTDSDDFVAYMIYKQGWVYLSEGTSLMFPE